MKHVEVVAAVIRKGDEIFVTKRGYGDMKGGWEFPGGKMEKGESREDALVREIREELDSEIVVKDHIATVEYDYPKFHLTMHCFFCELKEGELILKEHEDARWLTRETLASVSWLPADLVILDQIREALS